MRRCSSLTLQVEQLIEAGEPLSQDALDALDAPMRTWQMPTLMNAISFSQKATDALNVIYGSIRAIGNLVRWIGYQVDEFNRKLRHELQNRQLDRTWGTPRPYIKKRRRASPYTAPDLDAASTDQLP